MKRFFRLFHCLDRQQTANGMSISVAVFAIFFLHMESSPIPAGTDIARRPTNKQTLVFAAAKPEKSVQTVEPNETASNLTPEQQHERHLTDKISLIERGLQFLAKVPDYTAQFTKQELVNGDLLDEQEMEMKVRHAPFSVYMKWVAGNCGQEVLYVDGENDGLMKAHGGGWKARLPAVSLEPTSRIALAESRYPITKVGLYELAKMMLDVHRNDIKNKTIAKCEKLADQVFGERPCHTYLIEYKDRTVSQHYRKSISMIDKEWSIPVYTRNFGWLDGEIPSDPDKHDEATLIEFYSYSNIRLQLNLASNDFDHTNEDYGFKRQ